MVYVDMFCASVGLSTTYGISIFVWFLALCRVVEKFNVHSWDLKSLAFRRLLPVSKGDGALPTDRPYPLRHQVPPGVDHQVPQEAVTRRRRPPVPHRSFARSVRSRRSRSSRVMSARTTSTCSSPARRTCRRAT